MRPVFIVTKYDLITIEAIDKHGHTDMYLWGRDADGNRKRIVDHTWYPYFYVPKGALLITDQLHRTNEIVPDLFGDWTEKLTTSLSGNVGQLRKLFDRHWQADVMPEIAYMVERNIFASFETVFQDGKLKVVPCDPIYAPLRICFMDMEVDATPERFPEAKDALEAIVSVATFDTKLAKWVLFCWRADQEQCEVLVTDDTVARIFNNEKDMVKAIVSYYALRGFDCFIGWNTNTWDWPYLINRCRILGVDCRNISPVQTFYYKEKFDPETKRMKTRIICKGRVMGDGLDWYKKMTSFEAKLESYSLEYVVWHELKEVRVKQVIHDLWQKDDILEVANYPKKDTDWVIRIFEKRKIIEYFSMIRRYTGCRLEDAAVNSKVLDSLILHRAHAEGFVLPSKAPYQEKKPKGSLYKGAMVREPKVGLYWCVGVLDFTSHYPYITIACNMSPETLDPNGEIEVGNGVRFTSKREGFVPRVIRGLVDERVLIKAKMDGLVIDSPEWNLLYQHQFALKFLITSFYGVFAYTGFRLYKLEIASSITFLGRDLMQHAIMIVEGDKWFNRVVLYGDTDSFFTTMQKVSWEELLRVQEMVNEELKQLCVKRGYQTTVSMKAERIYDGIIFMYLSGASKVKLMKRRKKKVRQEGAKKKYYGRIKWQDGKFIEKDKWDNKNTAAKRSDASRFTHEVQTRVLQDPINKVPVQLIEEYVELMKVEIRKRPLVEVGIPRGVKSFYENSPWSKGSLWMRDHFDPLVLQHLKPKLLYVKPAEIGKLKKRDGTNCTPTDCVCFDDPDTLPPEIRKCIDWDKMIQKTITAKTAEIVVAVSAKKQKTMEAFMYG